MALVRLGAAAALCLGVAACSAGGAAYDPPPPDATVVTMTALLSFAPNTIAIRQGETIEWRNQSPFTHTVTADPALAADAAHVALPSGAEPFHSGEVPAGATYRRTFMSPGTYKYLCRPHEGRNMLGTVVVLPAS